MRDEPILIVDDDSSIRETVSELLDMRMPVMDGWGFARAAAERGIKIPVLVMTAAENAKTWADEIGADGFVAKPFDLDDLISAVQRLVPAA